MTDEIGIIIDSLRKKFDQVIALDNIDLKIPKGTILGLLGQNGAGKTTLVRLLSGVMKPTKGTAELYGYDLIRDNLDVKRITGLLPEEYALYEKLSVLEYLEFLSSLYELGENEFQTRFVKLSKQLNLYELRHRLIETLSKGQKQKVALIAALIHKPKILFLDEPLANLDISAQQIVKDIIREYKQKNRIIIIATHLMNNVKETCDYVVIIHEGRIKYSDTLKKFKGTYNDLENAYLSYVSV